MRIDTAPVEFQGLLKLLARRVEGKGCSKFSFLEPRQRQRILSQVEVFTKEAQVVLPETTRTIDASRFHSTGISLWESLYEAALRAIDPDVRGLDELKDYFDRFVK